MSSLLPRPKSHTLLLANIALTTVIRAQAGKFGKSSKQLLWISAIAMGLLLRQLFPRTDKRFITNHASLSESEEYDIIIVGGGTIEHAVRDAFYLNHCLQVLLGVCSLRVYQRIRL
jgi:hypothetical protein